MNDSSPEDPGTAGRRSAGRYLWWLVTCQRRRADAGALLGSTWMVGLIVVGVLLIGGLTVRPGERLALVGPSGAGKTTLARLLAGIEAPHAGSVTAGQVPISGLDPERLRRQVVLVTQEHHVFLGTVRENLRMAADSAPTTSWWRATAPTPPSGAPGTAAARPRPRQA